jgi:predicted nucleotidyltransferase component of viral defense system
MNTFERSPARPTVTRPFGVDSPCFTGDADVPTFAIEELTATKIRALFQRRKGGDLFDLWLAVEYGGASIHDILECFEPYRPDGWTVERALDNLDAKLNLDDFTGDLEQFVNANPNGYTINAAAEVARRIIFAVG